jgi:hypothetical protein
MPQTTQEQARWSSTAERITKLHAVFVQQRKDDWVVAEQYKASEFAAWVGNNDSTLPLLRYHRGPTVGEIRFGEGATHYKDFDAMQYLKADGTIKKRLKCCFDGLIYTR